MKLITKRLEELIEKSGYYPEVNELMEAPVLVKYFNPTGAGTWLIVGGKKWKVNGFYMDVPPSAMAGNGAALR